jgi:hypothetical protein
MATQLAGSIEETRDIASRGCEMLSVKDALAEARADLVVPRSQLFSIDPQDASQRAFVRALSIRYYQDL